MKEHSTREPALVPPSSNRRLRWAALLVVVVAVLAVTVSGWASLTHRSAVHSLHTELGKITPLSAIVVEEYIDRCWQGVGPASVRRLQAATGAGNLQTIRNDYLTALTANGFTNQGTTMSTRERDDALDLDIVDLAISNGGTILQIVVDVYDTDSVTCLPFD